MGIVMMKKYSAAYLSYGTYTFGAGVANTHRILQSIESFASGMAYSTSDACTTFPQGSEGLMKNVLYICPIPPSENLEFDGTAYGNVTVYLNSTVGYRIYLTKLYLDIVTVDSSGAEISLIGGDNIILESKVYVSDATKTVVVPFWINISKKKVSNSDRIGLRVKLYGYISGLWSNPQNYFDMDLKVDPSADQLFFEMPVAVTGE